MKINAELGKLLEVMVKLHAMGLLSSLDSKKREILTTDQMKNAYRACNGVNSISEIAEYIGSRALEGYFPDWEQKGIIISVGYGGNKRYLALENVSSYISKRIHEISQGNEN